MSSPFEDNRPGGRGGGNEPTDQWRPVDGEAWSNAGDTGSESPWSTAGGGAGGYANDNPFQGGGYQGGPGGYQGGQGGYQGGPGGYQGGHGGYPGGPGVYPGVYPGGYPGGPGGYPGQYPPTGGASAVGGAGRGTGGKVALIIVVMLLIVAAGGALGYFLLSDRGDDSGSAGLPVDAPTEETTTRARAEGFEAPSSWTKCGGSGDPGDLNLYYSGTSVTSCPFATAVRNAFVEHYRDTDRLDGTISAYSPVTGQTYSMSCSDDGDYVTCRGGNNAVVHIV